MKISHHDAWLDAEQLAIALERGVEMSDALDSFEITNVRAHVRHLAAHERERVLEVRAHGNERLGARHRNAQRQGRITTGAAHQHRRAIHESNDRVIHAGENFAVVQQEEIRDASEPAAWPHRCPSQSARR